MFILSCVTIVTYSLLINGNVWGTIIPKRALRQWNPFSPYLFILCSEVLSRLLLHENGDDHIHGIKVGWEAPTISHLLYADDLVITCSASKRKAAFVKEFFKKYCFWSRSLISFSPKALIEELSRVLREWLG